MAARMNAALWDVLVSDLRAAHAAGDEVKVERLRRALTGAGAVVEVAERVEVTWPGT